MAKEPSAKPSRMDAGVAIRLARAEREALDEAASADGRRPSALGRKVLVDWLRQNGWLDDGAGRTGAGAPPGPPKRRAGR